MAPRAMTMAGEIDEPARNRPRAEAGLSIVIPVFNEANNLPALHGRICEAAKQLRDRRNLACEVVYVDDGSRDATLAIAQELVADAVDIQLISLSRNFGKEAALLAGLDHARLGAVMFMDGDGQHSPALVETVLFGQSVPGYPSVVVGLMVLGGVQLVMIGIMGEYIGKILSELKARPVYFVAEHTLKTVADAGQTASEQPARTAAE